MSEREMATALLEKVPDYKLGYVVAYLQGITADEAADDAFCEALVERYLNDPEKGEGITLEALCEREGISL